MARRRGRRETRIRSPPRRHSLTAVRYRPAGLSRQVWGLGVALAHIRHILAVRDEGSAPCRHVQNLVAANIDRIESQIADLQALRTDLHRLQRELKRRLPSEAQAAVDCPCLEIIAQFRRGARRPGRA
ncbi:MAG: MerR family DNA-binding protein [Armatimonadota bacterium]|nr:MerR family DNA-binding protein [Armatimonadota bacterium]MDR7468399.1 MerR family DNA-binding protein [Armatimonadota bacterium]MDR7494984.1 MerR family DNA-binding protein [Armatimonadota bacterium]MDR7559562.1 MerR family DNA-binding protein [Armatimonadota bacterium]MDR7574256.1 MerR family DNA-binding protein [Armatimonadota bacterium]